jgi:hypothetical protein
MFREFVTNVKYLKKKAAKVYAVYGLVLYCRKKKESKEKSYLTRREGREKNSGSNKQIE